MEDEDAVALDSSNKVFKVGKNGKYSFDFNDTGTTTTTVEIKKDGQSQSMKVIMDKSVAEAMRSGMEDGDEDLIKKVSKAINNDFEKGKTYDLSGKSLDNVIKKINKIGNGGVNPI